MKNPYYPKDLMTYFHKAIRIQRDSFKIGFAEYKLQQSCDTLIRCGFCSGHKHCDKCLLQEAHTQTLFALRDPAEVQKRYERYVAHMNELNGIPAHDGRKRSIDCKGHVTEVLAYNLPKRPKIEG